MTSRVVTFLFTDIEGSTALWEKHEAQMAKALPRHDEILRASIEKAGGTVFKTVGDAFCAVFENPDSALEAALNSQRLLEAEPWPEPVVLKVRMAVHAGPAAPVGDDWFGQTVNRVARLLSLGHGGQTLISQAAFSIASQDTLGKLTVTDLGEHVLKGLSQPERVRQVVEFGSPQTFPPLNSSTAFVGNVPEQLTSFVGRATELRKLSELVEANRLVTLSGAGGVGKTRLVVEFLNGSDIGRRSHVWFIDLSQITDADQVPSAILAAIGAQEKSGRPSLDLLVDYLAQKKCVLVLDNCEQIVEGVARVASAILSKCKLVRIIATSRESLRIAGEVVFRVPSLALPSDDAAYEDVIESEAVALFLERATLARPDFVLAPGDASHVLAICAQLDGIPLAIELAAARLRTMQLPEILKRLNDRFRLLVAGDRAALPRRQTLRATIEWSTSLLTSDERLVFDRLSVFRGGWTMEAAEKICDDETLSSWDVTDIVTSLADKSLVVVDDSGRFKLLESLRQIAEENLARRDAEPATTRAKHVQYFTSWVESSEQDVSGAGQSEWFSRFDQESDNILAVLDYANADERLREPVRMMTNLLGRYWMSRGNFGIVWPRLLKLVESEPTSASKPLAYALVAAAMVSFVGNALATSGRMFATARAHFLEMGERAAYLRATSNQATVLFANAELQEARSLITEVLEESRATGSADSEAASLGLLGTIERASGRSQEAWEIHTRCAEIWRMSPNRHGLGVCLNNLGHSSLDLGRLDEAEALYKESLEIRQELGDRQGLIWSLEGFAKLALARGDFDRAALLLGAAVRQRVDRGMPVHRVDQHELDEVESRLVSHLGLTHFNAIWAEGHELKLDDAIQEALKGRPIIPCDF